MQFVNVATAREFNYWSKKITSKLPEIDYVTLSAANVLEVHFALIDHFETMGVEIGGVGPRDEGLLESAVARQQTGFAGKAKWNTQYEIAATLFYGLVKNHAFHDANKRTALLSLLFHLDKCGKCLLLDDQQLEDFTVDVAEGDLNKYRRAGNGSRQISRSSEADEQVRIIAKWIRRNIRNIDDEYREISYEKLKTNLNKFGFDLQDPKANHINLVRIGKKRSLFGLGPLKRTADRLSRVGFYSWKSNVPRSEMKHIREAAGLTRLNGIDAVAFYGWEDPIKYLLGRYEIPLRNLASR